MCLAKTPTIWELQFMPCVWQTGWFFKGFWKSQRRTSLSIFWCQKFPPKRTASVSSFFGRPRKARTSALPTWWKPNQSRISALCELSHVGMLPQLGANLGLVWSQIHLLCLAKINVFAMHGPRCYTNVCICLHQFQLKNGWTVNNVSQMFSISKNQINNQVTNRFFQLTLFLQLCFNLHRFSSASQATHHHTEPPGAAQRHVQPPPIRHKAHVPAAVRADQRQNDDLALAAWKWSEGPFFGTTRLFDLQKWLVNRRVRVLWENWFLGFWLARNLSETDWNLKDRFCWCFWPSRKVQVGRKNHEIKRSFCRKTAEPFRKIGWTCWRKNHKMMRR